MAELDQLNVATHRYIRDNPALVDLVFQQGPLIAYAKQNLREPHAGGTVIGENFIYGVMHGGSYLKGKTFNITEKQTDQQCQFNPKFFEVNIPIHLEDVEVLNAGPAAAYRMIDSKMSNGYMSMGAFQEIAMFLNGVNANYTPNFNGLPEALNDNVTAGWDGNLYSTYGGITRGGSVGTALNSAPVNVAGAIEYTTLEEQYGNVSFGAGMYEPNLTVCTMLARSYIKQRFQTQQRFNDTQDPAIGFNGMKFNASTVIGTRYAPGTYISGTGDPAAVEYITDMSGGALTAYPTLTAETIWFINARKPFFNYYMSNSPLYSLGFTGFKPAQGSTKFVGQILAACAVTFAPRYHKQLYGITS